jgi:aminomethyltransferase
MVPFGGWDMPLHYGSQIEEHHAVRRRAGIFDVSHMTIVDVEGSGAPEYLRRLLANDVARLAPGQALYSCMLNGGGGVIDDLIAYRRTAPGAWRVVVNASTRDKDLAWMQAESEGFGVALTERTDLIMLALQGPETRDLARSLLPEESFSLEPFHAADTAGAFVARTGYTGEDGFEVIMPIPAGLRLWDAALGAGFAPCGLGARDTLRLEAGMNLYGQDMDEATSPLVSGLGWTVAFDPAERRFNGRDALEAERSRGPAARLTGLVLAERGVMRRGQRVVTTAGDGEVTSGGFSPTMNRSIALARVPAGATGTDFQVEIRGALRAARAVRPPFVRNSLVLAD